MQYLSIYFVSVGHVRMWRLASEPHGFTPLGVHSSVRGLPGLHIFATLSGFPKDTGEGKVRFSHLQCS